jgi:hypothetical protein
MWATVADRASRSASMRSMISRPRGVIPTSDNSAIRFSRFASRAATPGGGTAACRPRSRGGRHAQPGALRSSLRRLGRRRRRRWQHVALDDRCRDARARAHAGALHHVAAHVGARLPLLRGVHRCPAGAERQAAQDVGRVLRWAAALAPLHGGGVKSRPRVAGTLSQVGIQNDRVAVLALVVLVLDEVADRARTPDLLPPRAHAVRVERGGRSLPAWPRQRSARRSSPRSARLPCPSRGG